MIVVSDTSPLCYLALLGEIDLLAVLFDEISIPPEVARELTRPGTPNEVRSWFDARPAWLHRTDTPDIGRVPVTPKLHRGEQEVIALGLELKPDYLLLDDRSARGVARQLGLQVMGTLAILELGARLGHVDLPSALARLAKTNFRASPELLRNLLP